MTPLDFVTTAADDSYNTPAGVIADAMKKPLIVRSAEATWEILSYYYDTTSKRMVVDITTKTMFVR